MIYYFIEFTALIAVNLTSATLSSASIKVTG